MERLDEYELNDLLLFVFRNRKELSLDGAFMHCIISKRRDMTGMG